ncbi:MAG: protein serine/threonine phosphatase 2C family protein [Candidatus Magasanikbacteria bacterium]|jgi:serine/threonine protein phosphatase PrpC|nr:protein serine/threonine phosphatase 2C family protein [Candidatus Magasanikbacteria bacterium]MBT4220704.1 protein serine/threonine phosphatase 2C family protein [Candidatus Magasanikbacteria bacterium]MBT4350049.1 protein serine/threonine phosphatase 2C family protein [Candidatus Magasanikbacteria bacterium]MBT4541508.1 protein serine/threonine phosphatase 2C family protein [Candidatus Magasanikbacteria bacterium]MBT6253036.1 protein serine/threonine phosphatase 2C family protein [Candidat
MGNQNKDSDGVDLSFLEGNDAPSGDVLARNETTTDEFPRDVILPQCVAVGLEWIGKRREQQDRYWFGEIKTLSGEKVFLALVCDGVGNCVDGAKGAQTAVDAVREFVSKLTQTDLLNVDTVRLAFTRIIVRAHKCVLVTEPRGMSTTIAAILVVRGHLFSANAGDSRVYTLFNHLAQLSMDHRQVSLRENGERVVSPNVITRALGQEGDLFPHVEDHACALPGAFVLFSDGFSPFYDQAEAVGEVLSLALEGDPSEHEARIAADLILKELQELVQGDTYVDNATVLIGYITPVTA